MTFQIRKRYSGTGRIRRMRCPIYFIEKKEGDPLTVEFDLGRKIIHALDLNQAVIDTLVMVASLPKLHQSMLGASIARHHDLKVGGIVEISGSCSSLLDAIHYIFCCVDDGESALILAVDSFLSSYKATSNGQGWVDGGGGFCFDGEGLLSLTLMAYVSAFDHKFMEVAHHMQEEITIPFIPNSVEGFAEADLMAIKCVVSCAVDQAGLKIGDLSGVVSVNRSGSALKRVMENVGDIRIFESREKNSHSGAVDMIANMSEALTEIKQGYICLLGFGLGYSWQAMILKIS